MTRTFLKQKQTQEQIGNMIFVYRVTDQLKKQCIAAYQK